MLFFSLKRYPQVASKFDELLSACAHPDLYRRNGFRTLGLAVPAEPRGIARRFDALGIELELASASEMWAFAPQPAPDRESLRAAARALQEPMRRLLDELFWFWPLSYPVAGPDVALSHLARGDTAAATLEWSEAAGRGVTAAWHNLAVYQHLLALEWELAAGHDSTTLNQLWREAADYWQKVQADDRFWQILRERIKALDDAQLPASAVDHLKQRLPEILARIQTENAVHYVARNDAQTARLHVQLAQSHLSPARLAAVVEATAQPAVARLENQVAQARRHAAAHPADALAPLRALLQAVAPDLALLEILASSPETAHLHGDQVRLVADTVLDGLVACQRVTGDDLGCLPLIFHLLDIASAPELTQRTEQAFGVMLENALVAARSSAGEPTPPDHVLTLDLITRSVSTGLHSLGLTSAAAVATQARLAGWLEKLAEEALAQSPANLGWALQTLGHALDRPLDTANREALIRIQNEWLLPSRAPSLQPFVLIAGENNLRIDASGVALHNKLLRTADFTGVRHRLAGFSGDIPLHIGWCSADEGLALDEAWFAGLKGMVNPASAARNILAALHAFLVPSLVARSIAAVRSGGVIALGETQLSAEGLALSEGGVPVPYARLRLAYAPERVSISSADTPSLTVDLDPLLNWNVVLLPHFIAAFTPRLP
ncbi:MAG: hypothetical protein RIQ79_1987 [Verrucomicrobiota bacterium]